MLQAVRFQLHFGPYQAPPFKRGSVVWDEMRGEVKIVGLTAGRIPWPIGIGKNSRSPVLYEGLAKAVLKESGVAVLHWWGVSQWRLWKWRRALGATEISEGTQRLKRQYGQEPFFKRAQRKAWSKARDPVRCEKIAAAKRGKKRPAEVVAKMAAAKRGKKASAETRRKLSAARKRAWLSGPLAERRWTSQEDEWLRTLPSPEVVRLTGRTVNAVRSRRHNLGLPDGRAGRRVSMSAPGRWTPELDAIVRELTQGEAVKKTGRSISAVHSRRNQLGVNSGRNNDGRRPS